MKHFTQIEMPKIDVAPLLGQIAAHPELWGYDDSWTRGKPAELCAVYGVDVIVLRYNWPQTLPGNEQRWNKTALGVLTEAIPIILDVMRALPGEHLGKILITRMHPGDEIKPHTHQMPLLSPLGEQRWPHYFRRFQIPLQVDRGCVFRCGDEELWMRPGTAWGFDDTDPDILHSVFNGSDTDRISMLADIRPLE